MYLFQAQVQGHMTGSIAELQKNKIHAQSPSETLLNKFGNKHAVPIDQWGSHSLKCRALETISTQRQQHDTKNTLRCTCYQYKQASNTLNQIIRHLSCIYHFEECSMPRPLHVSIIPLNLERYS